mgnify:CR=1 FL=1
MTADELNQIVGAIQKGFKGTGGNSGGTANNSAASNLGSAYSASIKGATAAAGDLGKALAAGGGKVSDFADAMMPALGGLGAAFTGIVGYIEVTNDMFNGLSKVGAGFNGDLGQLRLSAAETRMGFVDFGNIVGQNSEYLASFAGGVNGGVKQFTALSKSMYESGAIDGFMNLGYTVTEANEFLLTNMQLTSRQARIENMTTDQQVAAALELAGQMDVMAKLTGKSAKEQQGKLVDMSRDGATRASLMLLEKKGIQGVQAGFDTSMTALQAGGPVLQKLFQDMTQQGTALSPLTQNYMGLNAKAAALVKQMAAVNKSDMDGESKKKKLAELGQLASAAALESAGSVQNLTVASLGQVSDIAKSQADVLESTGPLIEQMASYASKQGLVLGETITYQQAYLETLKQTKAASDTQTAGTGQGQDAQQAMNESTRTLANSASKVNTALADQIQSNDKVSQLLAKSAEAFAAIVGVSATLAVTSIESLTPGQAVTEGADSARLTVDDAPTKQALRDVNRGSQADKDAFAAKFGAIIDQDALKVGIVRIDKGALPRLTRENAASESELPGTGKGPLATMFDKMAREDGGPVAKDKPYIVGEKRPEVFMPKSNGNIFPNTDMLDNLIPNMKSMVSRLPAAMEQAKTATLAGSNTTSSMGSMGGMSGDDLSTLIKHVEVTNELLNQIAGINTSQARTGEKHLRSARGAGNLMNGFGRA